MTHPHRDLIIALLDDPTLEVEVLAEGTVMTNAEYAIAQMLRFPHRTYCLREKPKPDVVVEYCIELSDSVGNDPQGAPLNFWTTRKPNCKFTFSADGVLKSAEVI